MKRKRLPSAFQWKAELKMWDWNGLGLDHIMSAQAEIVRYYGYGIAFHRRGHLFRDGSLYSTLEKKMLAENLI